MYAALTVSRERDALKCHILCPLNYAKTSNIAPRRIRVKFSILTLFQTQLCDSKPLSQERVRAINYSTISTTTMMNVGWRKRLSA